MGAMTEHGRERMERAIACDLEDVEEVGDAVRGLQSTEDPSLMPLHDLLMKRFKARQKAKKNNADE